MGRPEKITSALLDASSLLGVVMGEETFACLKPLLAAVDREEIRLVDPGRADGAHRRIDRHLTGGDLTATVAIGHDPHPVGGALHRRRDARGAAERRVPRPAPWAVGLHPQGGVMFLVTGLALLIGLGTATWLVIQVSRPKVSGPFDPFAAAFIALLLALYIVGLITCLPGVIA